MKPKSLSKTPLIPAVIFASAFFAILWYLNTKELKTVTDLQQQINALQADEAKYNDDLTQYSSFQTLLTTWEQSLPKNETQVAVFASSVENLAKSQTLALTLDFEDFPGQVDIGGRYATGIGLEMNLQGSYQNLTAFIHKLNALPYFFKIDKLILTQEELKPGVKATLTGTLIMQ